MGATIAAAQNHQPGNLTPENFEAVHDAFSAAEDWTHTEISILADATPHIDSIELSGNISEDNIYEERGKIRAFTVKSTEGDLVRFSLEGGSVSVQTHRPNTSSSASVSYPEWTSVHMIGVFLLFAFHSVDQFIEKNGLRPVVDEVEERKWAIMLALQMIAVAYQLGF